MKMTTGTHLDHYEIIAPLGVGGMGEVYRAIRALTAKSPSKSCPLHLRMMPTACAALSWKRAQLRRSITRTF